MTFMKKEKATAYKKKRIASNKSKLISLLGGCCVECGTIDNLEFHHIDRKTKLFRISNALGWSYERIVPEAMKCELRCKKHHIDVHAAIHGSKSKYEAGCRCDLCVYVYRDYNKNRMKKYRTEGKDKTRKNYNPGMVGMYTLGT